MLEFPSSQLAAYRSFTCQAGLFSVMAGWLLITSTLALASSYSTAITPSIQPTFIGLIWSNWFFAGFSLGVWHNGRRVFVAIFSATISAVGFESLTDFSLLEGLMLCAPSLAVGRWHGRKLSSQLTDDPDTSERRSQWSILDLLLLTTGVATFIGGIQSRNVPWPMLAVVALTLVSGLVLSWSAMLLVFRDFLANKALRQIDVWTSRIYVCFCFVALGTLGFQSELLSILWSGPVPVVAAQGCFVLVGASVIRLAMGGTGKVV